MSHVARALAALAVIGGCVAGGVAVARGPFTVPSFDGGAPTWGGTSFNGGNSFFFQPGAPSPQDFTPRRSRYDDDEPRPSRHHHSSGAVARNFGGPAVCVKLCDGAFFPAANGASSDAACAAQCPDAPTALYSMTSDRIDDAVSLTGAPYSKLPVAKRFETSTDATCACHRNGYASRARQLLADPTLRKGDVVMTAEGFRVYEGGQTASQAFVALSRATDVPKDERAALAAMEKANAASLALVAPATPADRPKGNVTVDDGQPSPRP